MSARTSYAPAGFNREDAADYLGISPRKLDEIQAAGELIAKQLGARRMFLREDLEQYLRDLPDWERRSTQ
jgi:excisionase family DNA binding protein